MKIGTHDPIVNLSIDILELCEGHDITTVVAAIGASLGIVLDELSKEMRVDSHPPAAKQFRYDLQQVVAEAMPFRRGVRES